MTHDLLVTGAVQNYDSDVVKGFISGLCNPDDVLRRGKVDVYYLGPLRPDHQFIHIEDVLGVEHRTPLGEGDHADRAGKAERGQPCSINRVDSDVHLRIVLRTKLLSVEEHRRLVLLPLAYYHDTGHRDCVHHIP